MYLALELQVAKHRDPFMWHDHNGIQVYLKVFIVQCTEITQEEQGFFLNKLLIVGITTGNVVSASVTEICFLLT